MRTHIIASNSGKKSTTVILQIWGVVLFSVFSVVDSVTENKKRHLNEKNTLRETTASTDTEI